MQALHNVLLDSQLGRGAGGLNWAGFCDNPNFIIYASINEHRPSRAFCPVAVTGGK